MSSGSNPDEEFDRLQKRWEIAREIVRHESLQMNQRYIRMFTVMGFLVGAYFLLVRQTVAPGTPFLEELIACGFMVILALVGLATAWSIIGEIDAAGESVYSTQRWWCDILSEANDVGAGRSRAPWFPDLQYLETSDIGPMPIPRMSSRFRPLRIVLLGIWGILICLAVFLAMVAVAQRGKPDGPIDKHGQTTRPDYSLDFNLNVLGRLEEEDDQSDGAANGSTDPDESNEDNASAVPNNAARDQQQANAATNSSEDRSKPTDSTPLASAVVVATLSIVTVVGKLLSTQNTGPQ